MFVLAAGIFGAILGSFLNALLFRYNTGRSVMHGRSQCMRCGHTLQWYDLILVLSWVFLLGRCRYCGAKVSVQYPLVEAVAAMLVAGVFILHPEPLRFALDTLLWLTLLFVLVYDLRHQIIPWLAIGIISVLGFISFLFTTDLSVWAFLSGPLVAAPLLFISLVSRGRWMGWGDGLIELGLGWILGLTAGYTALACAFWSGALVGIALLALNRAYTIKSEVPFAPFLILGAGIAYFFHADLFQALPALFF